VFFKKRNVQVSGQGRIREVFIGSELGLCPSSAVCQELFTEVRDGNAGPGHGGQAFDSAEERFAQDDCLFCGLG
jgi:hypothetical protein